ncbi:hypothetical protein JCM18237_06270 [Halorubrum luteum]
MSSELEKKVEEYQEDLRTVANADCSASWIAHTILGRFDMDTMDTSSQPENPQEPSTEADISPQNPSEPEGSIFAY